MKPERVMVAMAVVQWQGRLLVGERAAGQSLAGYWEFPGGKIAAGELPERAAERECLEETGLAVRVVDRLLECDWDYPEARLRLSFFACRLLQPPTNDRLPAARGSFRWVTRAELARLRFPPANAAVLAVIQAASRTE